MSHTVPGAPQWTQVTAPAPGATTGSTSVATGPASPSQPATLWTEGRVRGRDVVLGTVAITLAVVALDLILSGRLSFFFDVCLVPICLIAALAVRPREFFWVAVLPPLLVLTTTLQLGFVAPGAVGAADDNAVQAALLGLADHGQATLWAQALTLATLAIRRRVLSLPTLVPASGKLPPPVDIQGDLVAAYDDAVDVAGPEALARVDALNADSPRRALS